MNNIMSAVHEEVVISIQTHMMRVGSDANLWYVGLANNIKKKLFEDNKVSEHNGKWIYRILESNAEAMEIKKHLVSVGMKSNDNDDTDGNTVFAYQKPNLEK